MSAESVSRIIRPDLFEFRGYNGNKVLKVVKLEDGTYGAIEDGITYHIQLDDESLIGKYVECIVSVDNKCDRWKAAPICEVEVENELIDEYSDDIIVDQPELEPQDPIVIVLSELSAIQQSLKDIMGIVKSNADRISTLESRFDRFPEEICREVSKQVKGAVSAFVIQLMSDLNSGVKSQIDKNTDTTVLLGSDSISSTLFTSESYSVHYCPSDKTLHIREEAEGGYNPKNRIITIPNLRKLTSVSTPRKVDAISSDGIIVISLANKIS